MTQKHAVISVLATAKLQNIWLYLKKCISCNSLKRCCCCSASSDNLFANIWKIPFSFTDSRGFTERYKSVGYYEQILIPLGDASTKQKCMSVKTNRLQLKQEGILAFVSLCDINIILPHVQYIMLLNGERKACDMYYCSCTVSALQQQSKVQKCSVCVLDKGSLCWMEQ